MATRSNGSAGIYAGNGGGGALTFEEINQYSQYFVDDGTSTVNKKTKMNFNANASNSVYTTSGKVHSLGLNLNYIIKI